MSTAVGPRVQPERRGVPWTFSLDQDAKRGQGRWCPTSRGQGLMISELIRKEAAAWRNGRSCWRNWRLQIQAMGSRGVETPWSSA